VTNLGQRFVRLFAAIGNVLSDGVEQNIDEKGVCWCGHIALQYTHTEEYTQFDLVTGKTWHPTTRSMECA
jgi:hypothetical protein